MTTVLAKQLVLVQTSTDPAVAVTRSYRVAPGNAVQVSLTVLSITGVGADLAVSVDLSNDDAEWAQEGATVSGLNFVGQFAAPAGPDFAARFLRLRFALTSTFGNGRAVLAADVNRAEL